MNVSGAEFVMLPVATTHRHTHSTLVIRQSHPFFTLWVRWLCNFIKESKDTTHPHSATLFFYFSFLPSPSSPSFKNSHFLSFPFLCHPLSPFTLRPLSCFLPFLLFSVAIFPSIDQPPLNQIQHKLHRPSYPVRPI